MWIERQNTHNKVFIGIAITFLVYQMSIISKFNRQLALKYLLGWLITVLVLVVIINWLVNNGHKAVAWIVVLLPLVIIPTIVTGICTVCRVL